MKLSLEAALTQYIAMEIINKLTKKTLLNQNVWHTSATQLPNHTLIEFNETTLLPRFNILKSICN